MSVTVKPRIYIAGPFFNPPQRQIICRIEDLLHNAGFKHYSPRRDSGSADIPPERRKDYDVWQPIMASNVGEIRTCDMCIAVIEYAMPPEQALYVVSHKAPDAPVRATGRACIECGIELGSRVEIPDAGTTFEIGGFRILGKKVALFHSQRKPAAMNLMLSHGANALLCGWDALETFLESYDPGRSRNPASRFLWEDWHPKNVVKEVI